MVSMQKSKNAILIDLIALSSENKKGEKIKSTLFHAKLPVSRFFHLTGGRSKYPFSYDPTTTYKRSYMDMGVD